METLKRLLTREDGLHVNSDFLNSPNKEEAIAKNRGLIWKEKGFGQEKSLTVFVTGSLASQRYLE